MVQNILYVIECQKPYTENEVTRKLVPFDDQKTISFAHMVSNQINTENQTVLKTPFKKTPVNLEKLCKITQDMLKMHEICLKKLHNATTEDSNGITDVESTLRNAMQRFVQYDHEVSPMEDMYMLHCKSDQLMDIVYKVLYEESKPLHTEEDFKPILVNRLALFCMTASMNMNMILWLSNLLRYCRYIDQSEVFMMKQCLIHDIINCVRSFEIEETQEWNESTNNDKVVGNIKSMVDVICNISYHNLYDIEALRSGLNSDRAHYIKTKCLIKEKMKLEEYEETAELIKSNPRNENVWNIRPKIVQCEKKIHQCNTNIANLKESINNPNNEEYTNAIVPIWKKWVQECTHQMIHTRIHVFNHLDTLEWLYRRHFQDSGNILHYIQEHDIQEHGQNHNKPTRDLKTYAADLYLYREANFPKPMRK